MCVSTDVSIYSPRFPSNNVNKVIANGPGLSPSAELSMNGNGLVPNQEDKRPLEHIQTYRFVQHVMCSLNILSITERVKHNMLWGGLKCDVRSVANVIYPEIVENCWNEDGMTVPDITYLINTQCKI